MPARTRSGKVRQNPDKKNKWHGNLQGRKKFDNNALVYSYVEKKMVDHSDGTFDTGRSWRLVAKVAFVQ